MKNVVAYRASFSFVADENMSQVAPKVVEGINRVKGSAKGTQAVIEKQKGSLMELAGAYNALVVARHAARFISAAVQPAIQMENALTQMRVATGLSTEGLARLASAARETASITPFTPAEAVDAARRLNLALRDVEGTAKALTPVMSLAYTYLNKDINKATTIAVKLAGSLALRGGQTGEVLDKLVAGAKAAGVQVEDTYGGWHKFGTIVTRLGTSFDDVYSSMLLAIKGGLPASLAVTGLSTAVGKLADPQKRAILESTLGVMATQGDRFRSLRGILLDLATAQKEVDPVTFQKTLIKAFGERGIKAVLSVLGQLDRGVVDMNGNVRKGADAFAYQQVEMANSSGALAKSTKDAMQTFTGQVEIIKEGFGILLETGLTPFLHSITWVISGIKDFVNWLNKLTEGHETLRTVVGAVTSGIMTFLSVTIGLKLALGSLFAIGRILKVSQNFLNEALKGGATAADQEAASLDRLASRVGAASGAIKELAAAQTFEASASGQAATAATASSVASQAATGKAAKAAKEVAMVSTVAVAPIAAAPKAAPVSAAELKARVEKAFPQAESTATKAIELHARQAINVAEGRQRALFERVGKAFPQAETAAAKAIELQARQAANLVQAGSTISSAGAQTLEAASQQLTAAKGFDNAAFKQMSAAIKAEAAGVTFNAAAVSMQRTAAMQMTQGRAKVAGAAGAAAGTAAATGGTAAVAATAASRGGLFARMGARVAGMGSAGALLARGGGMVLKAIPYIGWAVTIGSMVYSIYDAFKSTDKAAEKMQDVAGAQRQIQEEGLKLADKVNRNLEAFSLTLDKAKNIKQLEMPLSPQNVMNKMNSAVQGLGASVGQTDQGFQRMQAQMQIINAIQAKIMAGGRIGDEEFAKAKQALLEIAVVTKGMNPQNKKLKQGLDALYESWDYAYTKSGDMASVLLKYGIGVDKAAAANREASYALKDQAFAEKQRAKTLKDESLLRLKKAAPAFGEIFKGPLAGKTGLLNTTPEQELKTMLELGKETYLKDLESRLLKAGPQMLKYVGGKLVPTIKHGPTEESALKIEKQMKAMRGFVKNMLFIDLIRDASSKQKLLENKAKAALDRALEAETRGTFANEGPASIFDIKQLGPTMSSIKANAEPKDFSKLTTTQAMRKTAEGISNLIDVTKKQKLTVTVNIDGKLIKKEETNKGKSGEVFVR